MKYFALTITVGIGLCASSAQSQTFKTLIEFTGTGGTASGANPQSSLTLSGSTLYGVTGHGGASSIGNIFSLGMDGANYRNLISFTGGTGTAAGRNPVGSLVIGGTTLYGMTYNGGLETYGNIFSVSTNGTDYQELIDFTGAIGAAIGAAPGGSLTLSGTTLFGITSGGGYVNNGNIFRVGTGGTGYQNLVSFTGRGGAASGYFPYSSLTLSGTTLYGMTTYGGDSGFGNVFSVGTGGTGYHNLASFTGTSGTASGNRAWGSVLLSGTTLYGMTALGGASGNGNIFCVGTNGTNYRNLLSFTGSGGAASGASPIGSLMLSGTTLYGMTQDGGSHSEGNTFSVGIDGSGFVDLYDFTGGTDGANPAGELTLSGGTLFGMTSAGGANAVGTIFALTLPAPTPEPGTLALVGVGAAALVTYRWRRIRMRRSDGAPQNSGGITAERDEYVAVRHEQST
jgi:uncharacterized repeat protein (TIGR03803 family)